MHQLQGLQWLLLKLQKEGEERAMCLKKRQLCRVQSIDDDEDDDDADRIYNINNIIINHSNIIREAAAAAGDGDGELGSFSFLDLPDLVIEEILCRMDPRSLCRLATACKQLWHLCSSDRIWENHFKTKWGRVIGPDSERKLQNCSIWSPNLGIVSGTVSTTANSSSSSNNSNSCSNSSCDQKGLRKLNSQFARLWRWFGMSKSRASERPPQNLLSSESVLAKYRALETGSKSFHAQIYNREHGHVGFLLSCYDAVLTYDHKNDSFQARYPPHGPRAVVIEDDIDWKRVRASPVHTQEHELYVSDCLEDLHPGDHVEVQWRRNKDFPYGWWYAVVGHYDGCVTRNNQHCRCHLHGTVWLEFNQYAPTSRWRRAAVNRKTHREEGNETEGFYAGIRKLYLTDDIKIWKNLWPTETLD